MNELVLLAVIFNSHLSYNQASFIIAPGLEIYGFLVPNIKDNRESS